MYCKVFEGYHACYANNIPDGILVQYRRIWHQHNDRVEEKSVCKDGKLQINTGGLSTTNEADISSFNSKFASMRLYNIKG